VEGPNACPPFVLMGNKQGQSRASRFWGELRQIGILHSWRSVEMPVDARRAAAVSRPAAGVVRVGQRPRSGPASAHRARRSSPVCRWGARTRVPDADRRWPGDLRHSQRTDGGTLEPPDQQIEELLTNGIGEGSEHLAELGRLGARLVCSERSICRELRDRYTALCNKSLADVSMMVLFMDATANAAQRTERGVCWWPGATPPEADVCCSPCVSANVNLTKMGWTSAAISRNADSGRPGWWSATAHRV
jgi:hypothetical protein